MRKIFEFYLLFLKVIVSDKISFVWTLVFPTILLIFFNINSLNEGPGVGSLLYTLATFLGYIVYIVSLNNVLNLITIRENGFLKMFYFISGSKYPIIAAQYLAQLSFLCMNFILVSAFVSVIYHVNFFAVLFFSMSIIIITFIPISIFNMWITALPLKNESLLPIVNIITLPLIIVAFAVDFTNNMILDFLILLNPVKFIFEVTMVLGTAVGFITSYDAVGSGRIVFLVINLSIYCFIGLMMTKYYKITSVASRN